jgi:hypothetical protein
MPFHITSGDIGDDHRDQVSQNGPLLAFFAHVALIEVVAIGSHPSRCEEVELTYHRGPRVLRDAIDGPEMELALGESRSPARRAAAEVTPPLEVPPVDEVIPFVRTLVAVCTMPAAVPSATDSSSNHGRTVCAPHAWWDPS